VEFEAARAAATLPAPPVATPATVQQVSATSKKRGRPPKKEAGATAATVPARQSQGVQSEVAVAAVKGKRGKPVGSKNKYSSYVQPKKQARAGAGKRKIRGTPELVEEIDSSDDEEPSTTPCTSTATSKTYTGTVQPQQQQKVKAASVPSEVKNMLGEEAAEALEELDDDEEEGDDEMDEEVGVEGGEVNDESSCGEEGVAMEEDPTPITTGQLMGLVGGVGWLLRSVLIHY